MKILNLFAGIGGNRSLWDGHEITAVEFDPRIAELYKKRFPKDDVVVGDAMDYMLNNMHEFDFIWASPPCTTHSNLIYPAYASAKKPIIIADLTKLYLWVNLERNKFTGKYIVENVHSDYHIKWGFPKPTAELGRHFYWANFNIPYMKFERKQFCHGGKSTKGTKETDYDELCDFAKIDPELFKDVPYIKKYLRNCVNPDIGKYILDCVLQIQIQKTLANFMKNEDEEK